MSTLYSLYRMWKLAVLLRLEINRLTEQTGTKSPLAKLADGLLRAEQPATYDLFQQECIAYREQTGQWPINTVTGTDEEPHP